MQCVVARCAGLCRGASAVWGLVDVLAVDVDGIRHEGGSTVTATGVALLKAEELQLGLDTLKDALAHVCVTR